MSSGIIQQVYASILGLNMTQVVDQDLVKVMSWYDNEWGYANQMGSRGASITGDRFGTGYVGVSG